jgi:uncharacterized protein (TIGR02145 family)
MALLAAAVGITGLAGCGGGDNVVNSGNNTNNNTGDNREANLSAPLVYVSQTSQTVTVNGVTWMMKNLNIATDSSWCYEDSPDSCAKYGRLYTWEAAKSACQLVGTGWRLPTSQDWDDLAAAVGGKPDFDAGNRWHDWLGTGKKLKSSNGWKWNDYVYGNGTDEYGFSALPGGDFYPKYQLFINVGHSGQWWTDTEPSAEIYREYIPMTYSRYMHYETDDLLEMGAYRDHALSVRCVLDAPPFEE